MIDLARSADFTLGPITVRPSSRELVGDAGAVMLEPKVMQVLVALAQAGGRVVPRDELIEHCWRGRIVGDDAVNRIIGKLRRIAEGPAGGAFRVETVARTGHRLLHDAPAPLEAAPIARGERRRTTRWLPLAGAGLGIAGTIGLVLFLTRPSPDASVPHPPTPRDMPAAVGDLETRGLAAMFENTPEQSAEGVDYLRRAAGFAPRAAPVWGSLAMSYALSLGWAAPGERAAVAARARAAAVHGLSLDPAENRSRAALVTLVPTFGRWTAKAAALAAAKRHAHADSGPLAYQEVQFLMTVGRDREALAVVERLVRFSPLVPWIRASHIDLLAAAGRLEEADRAADEAGAIWPRDRMIWFTRFDLAVFNGKPERALAMAADRPNWPKRTSASEVTLAERVARALISRDPFATAAVLDAVRTTAPHGQADAERAIRVAAALGRADIALTSAAQLYGNRLAPQPRATMLPLIGLPDAAEPPTAALFLFPGSALWRTPGFMPLMAKIGLVDYWRHAPPDLCRAPDLRAACRTAGIPSAADG